MNENQTNNMINAIGALAELSVTFYKACLASNVSDVEALKLTAIYIEKTLYSSQNINREETE